MKKKYEMLCGCYVGGAPAGIVFCAYHSKVRAFANELNFLRGYFLEHAGGEESPFVKRIDALIPRQP